MANRRILIPEIITPGRRLGRHINHDPRSLRFLVAGRGAAVQPKTVKYERRTPTYNQDNLGTCVPNSGAEVLGSEVFWDSIGTDLQRILIDPVAAQRWIVDVYRALTRRDPFPGQYEPDDTGSDGLTDAQELTDRKLISGYQHATSIPEAHAALQKAPFITGLPWYTSCNYPDGEGIVRGISGALEGGHELSCREYDMSRDLWWLDNHWTEDWGKAGRFAFDTPTFQRLLGEQGDVTAFVPNTQPAPTPLPVSPIVDPVAPDDDQFPVELTEPWLDGKHYTRREQKAADAIDKWLSRRSGDAQH
jgi:hypothetical protein